MIWQFKMFFRSCARLIFVWKENRYTNKKQQMQTKIEHVASLYIIIRYCILFSIILYWNVYKIQRRLCKKLVILQVKWIFSIFSQLNLLKLIFMTFLFFLDTNAGEAGVSDSNCLCIYLLLLEINYVFLQSQSSQQVYFTTTFQFIKQ